MTSDSPSPLARALLLVVDLQQPFLAAVPGADALLRRTSLAIAAARGLGLPVVFTEQVPAKLGSTRPELLALADQPPTVFAKDGFSALDSESLSALLAEGEIEHVLIAGIETPICIYQTALDALGSERQVTLLSDCLGGRRPDDCATALRYLERLGCHTLPTETVFYSILKTTKHPFFRDFTKLVKQYA
jgi:nicotinamidase-related amidase